MADIHSLVKSLNSASADTRAKAAEELAQLGDEASQAAVALCGAVADEVDAVRDWATNALESLQPPADAVDDLITLLRDTRADVAYMAATLLGRLGEAASSAADALATLLESPAALNARQQAALALGKIGTMTDHVKAALEKARGEKDARLSRLAGESLEQLESKK